MSVDQQQQKKILIFELEELELETQIGPEGRPIQTRSIVDWAKKRVRGKELSAEVVQKNFVEFISSMQEILSKSSLSSGDFDLETVEVDAEISASGQIGFMGTGLGMAGKGGIKFVFKHKNQSS